MAMQALTTDTMTQDERLATYDAFDAAWEAGYQAGLAGLSEKDESRPRDQTNVPWKWGWAVGTRDRK